NDQCYVEREITVNPTSLNNSGVGSFSATYYPDPVNGCQYNIQSSDITSTHNDFPSEPGYGYVWGMFEIRCKLSPDQFTYPSFWMVGTNAVPPEIDAFEHHGGDNTFFSSVHWGPNGASSHCSNF